MKYIKSNIGFIISMVVLAVIALNPEAKSLLLKGLIKSGLYEPDFVPAKAEGERAVPSALFRSVNGELIDVANSKGKVIFINFWAEWCPPCIAEMPSISNLAKHFKDEKDLLFLMANVDGELKASQDYFEKNNYPLPAFIPAGTIPKSIFQGTLPTTVIINKNGDIVYQHDGIADYNTQETKDFIKRLLED
ncbi:TlpA family protein disulfide reductase [Pelobium manganitolerans]|uniref:TlpA family protein disulfide reductase n=1 Tax=Pelobium manganitolerans TaxID=1842495 RepID=UPI000E73B925|nr:TlpA disulfide reductase family protein [Pelobium manganitolerans]